MWQRALATGESSVRSKPPTSMVPATRNSSPKRLMATFLASSIVETSGASSGFKILKVAL